MTVIEKINNVVEGRNNRFDLEKNFLLITKKKSFSIIEKTKKRVKFKFYKFIAS